MELKGPADFVSAADRESEDDAPGDAAAALPGLRVPDRGERPDGRASTRARASSSTRSTGRRTSSTASPTSPSPSRSSTRGGSSRASSTIPPKDEMFVAERGRGAWLGGERLRVAPDRDLSRAPRRARASRTRTRRARHARYLAMLGSGRCGRPPASVASPPRRSTWPTWRPGGSRSSSSSASRPGTWPRARCSSSEAGGRVTRARRRRRLPRARARSWLRTGVCTHRRWRCSVARAGVPRQRRDDARTSTARVSCAMRTTNAIERARAGARAKPRSPAKAR